MHSTRHQSVWLNGLILAWGILLLGACSPPPKEPDSAGGVRLTILGIAQDAGYPQADCRKSCCASLLAQGKRGANVVSLGLQDQDNQTSWMFEATPDFRFQLAQLLGPASINQLKGIFVTHAHIGHYTGLMHLGREAMGASQIPVYTMPRMTKFFTSFGPWSQLIQLQNIVLMPLVADSIVQLNSQIQVKPMVVPHRDEYSETVGFHIQGPRKSALFIPDIDKWEKWSQDIVKEIQKVDWAFLDGTFFENGEIPNRDMSEIPHPFVEESLNLFSSFSPQEKQKVFFIHFNHTNPLLQANSNARKKLVELGFPLIEEGMIFEL